VRPTEEKMITISENALEEMKKALADKGDNPCVRIYVQGYG
jgi:Fe-S cluster assembly iron-binding protein IscA